MIKFLDKTILVLVCLIPLALITGPFLPDLFLSLVSIFFLFISFLKKDYKYFQNKYFGIFLIFYFYICITSFFATDFLYSFVNAILYIRFIIFPIAVIYLVDNYKKILLYFFISTGLSLLIVLLSGYLQYFFHYSVFNYDYDGKRLSGIFGEELKLGSYLIRLFPIFLGLLFLLIKNRYLQICIFIFSFLTISVLVFLSGERAAFFYTILSTIIVVICLNRFLLIRIGVMIMAVSLIFFVLSNDSKVRERMIGDTVRHLNLSGLQTGELNIFSPTHEKIMLTSLKIYKDNYIFGTGVKSFRIECKKPKYFDKLGCRNHPHNTYVQLLNETGIFGFIFFTLIFFYISILLFKHFVHIYSRKKIFSNKYELDNFQICILLSIIITLWPFIPTGNFFNNWLSVIYYLPIGFLLSHKKINEYL